MPDSRIVQSGKYKGAGVEWVKYWKSHPPHWALSIHNRKTGNLHLVAMVAARTQDRAVILFCKRLQLNRLPRWLSVHYPWHGAWETYRLGEDRVQRVMNLKGTKMLFDYTRKSKAADAGLFD